MFGRRKEMLGSVAVCVLWPEGETILRLANHQRREVGQERKPYFNKNNLKVLWEPL
jgi:hypothetical protein